jgi:trehalose transport system substrate-binding protein
MWSCGRRPVGLLVATVLAVLAAACGPERAPVHAPGSPGGTSITFSVNLDQREVPAIQALLKRFQSEQRARFDIELVHRFRSRPAVTVNLLTSLSPDQLDRRIEQDRRAGRPRIQLFARDNVGLEGLVREGLVEDISDAPVPAGLGRATPALFGGRRFFLPFRPNVRLTYANKDALRRAGVAPPRTVEDFRLAAERLRAVSGQPKVTLSLSQGEPAAVTISEWILSFGGDPLVLNGPQAAAAFEFLQRLWEEGVLARESVLARYDTEIDNLRGARAWLVENWSYTSSELARRGVLDDFQVWPGWEGPNGAGHVIGGDVLGIPKGVTGRQREAALRLARFLMSERSQEFLVRANSWPSILPQAYHHVGPAQQETFAAIRSALDNGWAGRSVWYWCHVSQQMNEAVDHILMGHQPVEPLLDQLQARVDAAREQGAPCPPSG